MFCYAESGRDSPLLRRKPYKNARGSIEAKSSCSFQQRQFEPSPNMTKNKMFCLVYLQYKQTVMLVLTPPPWKNAHAFLPN